MELWPYMPQREVTEALEWRTDVIRCKGAEQRQALRVAPRQEYQYSMLMSPSQFARAKSLARASSHQEVLLPCWMELTEVGALSMGLTSIAFDTSYASYAVGRSVVLWDSDSGYEVRELTAVTAGGVEWAQPTERNYSRALIAPLQAVRFAQAFEAARGPNDLVRASARFVSTDTVDLGASGLYSAYRSHDVVLDRSYVTSDLRERFEREVEVFDNETGVVWTGPSYTYPVQSSQMTWDLLSREETWNLRQWLHTRRGRWKGFWLPSWNEDLTVTQPIAPANTTITVAGVGYPLYEGVRDIMIRTKSGVNHFRRVLSGANGLSGQEVLTLEGAAGITLAPADIELVCFITFMRLDADRVEIRHRAARAATVSVPVVEVPVP